MIFEDRKTNYLHGNIILFAIGAWEQKLSPNKLKTREGGQQKKFENLKKKMIFFSLRLYFCLHRKL